MSPRSLFHIILKVIGIYFVKEVLLLLPQLLSSLSLINQGLRTGGWFILFSVIITLAVYLVVIFYLVLDTDAVIDKFELVKGIEEENLSINIHRSTVLSIVIVLMGFVMIVTVLPYFLQAVYTYLREKNLASRFEGPRSVDFSSVILYGLELVFAIFLIAYKRAIVNFIELQRKK